MKKIDFTLGADPEFCVKRGDRNLYAEDYFGGRPDEGEIGSDGRGQVFELRPPPSKNPLDIVCSLHDILSAESSNNKTFQNSNWIASPYHGFFGGMGGHIHFGTKGLIDHDNSNRKFKQLIQILDAFLGSVSVLVEDSKKAKVRRNNDYGYASDYRFQSHGFEYRTPSTWLHSPQVAASILCLSKTIGDAYLNGHKIELYEDPETICSFINDVNKVKLKSLFDSNIWPTIENMPLYEKYHQYINVLHSLITSNKSTNNIGESMKENWGFSPSEDNKPAKLQKTSIDLIWA
jgi:hypothetical protein